MPYSHQEEAGKPRWLCSHIWLVNWDGSSMLDCLGISFFHGVFPAGWLGIFLWWRKMPQSGREAPSSLRVRPMTSVISLLQHSIGQSASRDQPAFEGRGSDSTMKEAVKYFGHDFQSATSWLGGWHIMITGIRYQSSCWQCRVKFTDRSNKEA